MKNVYVNRLTLLLSKSLISLLLVKYILCKMSVKIPKIIKPLLWTKKHSKNFLYKYITSGSNSC